MTTEKKPASNIRDYLNDPLLLPSCAYWIEFPLLNVSLTYPEERGLIVDTFDKELLKNAYWTREPTKSFSGYWTSLGTCNYKPRKVVMHAVLDPTYTPMIEDNLFIYGLVESDRTYLRLKGIDTYRVTYAGFFYKFKAALRSMKARYPDDYMYQPLYVRSK